MIRFHSLSKISANQQGFDDVLSLKVDLINVFQVASYRLVRLSRGR